MSRPWSPVFALPLILVLFAGCLGGEDKPKVDDKTVDAEECVGEGETKFCGAGAILDETGRDLRVDLKETDSLEAPVWAKGHVFEQHVFYGSREGGDGEHIVTMVVDDSGDCYQFGTTSKRAASDEAVFDLPILGCLAKADLATSAFGVDWDWMYDFPLTDGKTWPGKVQGLFNWNQNSFHDFDFTLEAEYHAAIDTPKGPFPGFVITGTTTDGEQLLLYNYVPAVGWFSHFWMYDITTEEADDVMFHAMSMGTSVGWSGKYLIDETETAVDAFFHPLGTAFSVVDGGNPVEDGNAVSRFAVPDGYDYLKGVVVPIACPGQAKVILVQPDNSQTQHDHTYDGDPAACADPDGGDADPVADQYTVTWWDGPAKAGDWTISVSGVGVFGYYIWLNAVDEVEYELVAEEAKAVAETV